MSLSPSRKMVLLMLARDQLLIGTLMAEEFYEHEAGEDGWSEWVSPNPDSYLMKCCDCGLVHELQFQVVKYESPRSEPGLQECDVVEDSRYAANFRARRFDDFSSPQPSQLEQEPNDHNPKDISSAYDTISRDELHMEHK